MNALMAPESIQLAARRAAKRDGVSLSRLIASALAEKVAALEVEEVLKRQAKRSDQPRFLEFLKRLGNEAPREGDELDNG